MRVRVLSFGVLKDWFGSLPSPLEIPEGATVAELLERLCGLTGRQTSLLRGIAVSVNAEYAPAVRRLCDGDEVGLLPPVSGGSQASDTGVDTGVSQLIELTREPIDAPGLIARAKQAEDGGVVVFDGIVRNNTRGRRTLHLDYEAYEDMARKQMDELAREARSRFGVHSVILVHRLGRLEVGETSVLIVVASAHRAEAFEACRWLIDTLKKTVPIWKKETFTDGAVWAAGEPFPAGLGLDGAEAASDK